MTWVEILSRHREVTARFRIAGPELRIGRGYDNDVVVDDPYVAPRHLRIFRDEAGQLLAEDMGSANGSFLEGGRSPFARIVVDGTKPIRIGQTYLRVREPDHAVERERLASPERPVLLFLAAAALGGVTLGIYMLKVWLTQTSEPRVSNYLTPLLTIVATVVVWSGLWALLSRIFSGRSHFLHNLLIVLAGAFALSLYNEFAQVAAFAWTWPAAGIYQYVVVWSILAAMCFFHLREVGPARLWLKGAIVTTVLATAIAAQTLQRSEAFSDSGRQNTTRLLMPPAFRAVPFRDADAFLGEITDLKGKLDRDRSQVKSVEAGR
jgi:hypothetical protein